MIQVGFRASKEDINKGPHDDRPSVVFLIIVAITNGNHSTTPASTTKRKNT